MNHPTPTRPMTSRAVLPVTAPDVCPWLTNRFLTHSKHPSYKTSNPVSPAPARIPPANRPSSFPPRPESRSIQNPYLKHPPAI